MAGCAGQVNGPCDIYEKYGAECVAAHSTTRKLYSKYDGPLYQVVRDSDGKTLDIGTIDGGYADAAAQDAFLEGTIGYISIIYDQTGHGNRYMVHISCPEWDCVTTTPHICQSMTNLRASIMWWMAPTMTAAAALTTETHQLTERL